MTKRVRLAVIAGLYAAFFGGPQAVAAIGAALGGLGGGAPSSGDYWSIAENADAGMPNTSIEFTADDCTALNAGTHPSGWARLSIPAAGAVLPFNNFLTNQYLSDCNVSRAGHYGAQAGAGSYAVLQRTAALASDFTVYARVGLVVNGGTTYSYSNFLNIFITGASAGNDNIGCYWRSTFAGTSWEGFAERVTGGVGSTDTARTFSIREMRHLIVLIQKEGTDMRCFVGDESGMYHYVGARTGVAAGVGSNYIRFVWQQASATSFPAGNPIAYWDYIRVVDGDGDYFP